ncbi:hypothetical protein PMIN06_002878 [Paraphaeosphaeria minitans]|uniref:Uncharacterized protein n=1 Tax=Paraphaeosphaeria minitans TaxID=565426 RepID=A0A9P6KSR9_9PLEO|nr:hypothetical protein PMIN01_03381 [Paraphaeosphaeria minitans]
MSHPRRSASTHSHQRDHHRPQPTPPAPEAKTLEWHKQNFYHQQQAWQLQAAIEVSSPPQAQAVRKLPAHVLNKPLPVRRMQTDDRDKQRVVNAGRTSTPPQDPERLRTRLAALRDGDVVAIAPFSKSSSVSSSIRRKPLPGMSREEATSFATTASDPPLPHARSNPGDATQARILDPAVPRRNAQEHTHASRVPSELSSTGMLGIPLSVYGFRGTLPAELQPKEPPLRWDNEPAPQMPPVGSDAVPSLYEDVELAKFMTANKSYLQPFTEKMPMATTIVKGKLNEVVEK